MKSVGFSSSSTKHLNVKMITIDDALNIISKQGEKGEGI